MSRLFRTFDQCGMRLKTKRCMGIIFFLADNYIVVNYHSNCQHEKLSYGCPFFAKLLHSSELI